MGIRLRIFVTRPHWAILLGSLVLVLGQVSVLAIQSGGGSQSGRRLGRRLSTEKTSQMPRASRPLNRSAIKKTIKQLKPIHVALGKPSEGEWLETHKERGQTFSQHLRIRPNVLSRARNRIYVQPIGTFSAKQDELIELSAEYRERCKERNQSRIPIVYQAVSVRRRGSWGDRGA